MKLHLSRVRTGFRTHMTTGEVIARKTGAVEMPDWWEERETALCFPLFPPVLGNPAKNAGLPHSHRTATTIEFGQFYFVATETNQLCSNKRM